MPLGQRLVLAWHDLDGFVLLFLGFGWSLVSIFLSAPTSNETHAFFSPQLLLPFSLASSADGGYKHSSLIAMFVVGGLCLCVWSLFTN